MSNLIFLRKSGYGTSLREYGFDTVKPDQQRKFARLNPNIIWRWGYYGQSELDSSYLTVNKSKSLQKVADKYGFLKLCTENNIRVPEITQDCELVDRWCENAPELSCVALGRKFNHFGGTDIKPIWEDSSFCAREISDVDFWVRYVKKLREFRIYTFFGKCVEVQEKIPEDRDAIAWNHSQGSHFINIRWNDWPTKAIWWVLKAAELTKIDYCAWDVILGDDHKYYILEGNTAPSITGEYNLSIMENMVDYLEDYFAEYNSLPDTSFIGEYITGYKNYIHPLMLNTTEVEDV